MANNIVITTEKIQDAVDELISTAVITKTHEDSTIEVDCKMLRLVTGFSLFYDQSNQTEMFLKINDTELQRNLIPCIKTRLKESVLESYVCSTKDNFGSFGKRRKK